MNGFRVYTIVRNDGWLITGAEYDAGKYGLPIRFGNPIDNEPLAMRQLVALELAAAYNRAHAAYNDAHADRETFATVKRIKEL